MNLPLYLLPNSENAFAIKSFLCRLDLRCSYLLGERR